MKKIFVISMIGFALILTGCGEKAVSAPVDTTSPLAKFTTCIKDAGAIFYGTTRCIHCNDQKVRFGTAVDLLPFIDCDKDKTACTNAGVKQYPTRAFKDGSKLEGNQELSVLATKTSCTLPM